MCKTCSKCQKCCLKSDCRGKTSKLLANLAGSGCRSQSSSNPERGLHPPLSDLAKTNKVSHSHKLLCQSPQEKLPAGGITSAYRQKCSRTSAKPTISRVSQPTIFGPKAQQQVETYTRSEQTKFFLKAEKFKMETPETIRTLSKVIQNHPGISFQFYADDTQLYEHLTHKNVASALDKLSHCLEDVKRWLSTNKHKLNPDKTEFIVFGSKSQREKLNQSFLVNILGNLISPIDAVRNLGVWFDSDFSFACHVMKACKACFAHVRDLK